MKLYFITVKFLQGQFFTKDLSVPRGNFLNYFIKMIVFSQLYRSKSRTLEIAYDMKNRFLVTYYIVPPQKKECKTKSIYIRIDYDITINESV